MIIDVKPEFGYEIACSIPYAYWLHKRGELENVITCKGMKPFYYFCDDVREEFKYIFTTRYNEIYNQEHNNFFCSD